MNIFKDVPYSGGVLTHVFSIKDGTPVKVIVYHSLSVCVCVCVRVCVVHVCVVYVVCVCVCMCIGEDFFLY